MDRFRNKIIKCFVSLILLLGIVSCGGGSSGTISMANGQNSNNNESGNSNSLQLTSITVNPTQATTHLGIPIQFMATASYSDGSTQDVTQLATWTSSNPTVASFDSTPGLAMPLATGNTNILATYLGESAYDTLTVGNAILNSVIVTPNPANIYAGAIQQFIATGIYSDGESEELTNLCTWLSSKQSVISINESGFSMALSQGDSIITATCFGIESTANAKVVLTDSLSTWINGENTINARGVYGIMGVESAANRPGARYFSAQWEDSFGNLWLFGGEGYDANGKFGSLNDLWKYDIQQNVWVWMGGSNINGSIGKYGTKGVESSTNMPGARSGAVSWTDDSGNFWLFGGSGNSISATGYLNDLWKYNIKDNCWTWVGGSDGSNSTGVYGTIGESSSNYMPSSRMFGTGWSDMSGNLWLFGGSGFSPTSKKPSSGNLNDLWKYNITDNSWTWVSGSSDVNIDGNYGTKFMESSTNMPGARDGAVSWIDKSGSLWLFGGNGYASVGNGGYLNDIWMFNTKKNVWVWIGGANTYNSSGNYGTLGVESVTNYPGARAYANSWTDGLGNLWLFGGFGYAESGAHNMLNDLWKFDINSKKWVWVNGQNTTNSTGIYGVQGQPSSDNMLGARMFASSWIDKSGSLWLFGGEGYPAVAQIGYLNDLWKIQLQ